MPGGLKAAAGEVLRQAGTYGDLLSADLAAGTRSLLQRVWAAVALAVSALLALQLACVLVISATWDTPDRWLALGSLLAFFVAAAAGAGPPGCPAQRWNGRRTARCSPSAWRRRRATKRRAAAKAASRAARRFAG